MNAIAGTANLSGLSSNAATYQTHPQTSKAEPVFTSEMDTVSFSKAGSLLAQAPMLLPTLNNVKILTAQLSQTISSILTEAGIAPMPPFEISENPDGSILVSGERNDLDTIAELLNNNEDFKKLNHTTTAIASHAYAIQEAMKFAEEYRNAANPEAVVRKYSHLFDKNSKTILSVKFDESGAEILFDGKPWEELTVDKSNPEA